jgi:queuine/archaeosine tRNA-ribosyltransferase|tara:strand:+ start:821 stop:1249 length:429 start_codon:yes stop_codon:yes gene_type:complete
MRKKAMDHIVAITKNDKQELSTHRVELNFQADIQKFLDEVYEEIDYNEKLNKSMDEAWAKARNAVNDLVEQTNEVKNHLPNLDVKADGKEMKDRVKKAADELGVKPDAVKGYDLIDLAVKDAKEQQTNAKINIKDSKPPKGD